MGRRLPTLVYRPRLRHVLAVVGLAMTASACGSSGPVEVSAQVSMVPFAERECADGFRTVDLPHVVEVQTPETSFDANGSGLAVGDLNGDGLVDLVYGSLHGKVAVFWNQGDLEFEREEVAEIRTRAIQLVDIDADMDLEIVIAPGDGPITILDNVGTDEPVAIRTIEEPSGPAYAMVWFDPDADNDLDVAFASYDMAFGEIIASEYISNARNGVWFLEQRDGEWLATQLSDLSHTLAITTLDLNQDGRIELLVGNDYGLEDGIWTWKDGWESTPDALTVTSANTMSYDHGDTDGDGNEELLATDMAPFSDANSEFWEPMAAMDHDPPGPQQIANTLVDTMDGADTAAAVGIDRSGWTWAGRLADFDQDRYLDAYFANGMLESALMPVIEGHELVETNHAFRNTGDGGFIYAPEWNLGSEASTRAIAAADLDNDGDLDLATSTVGSPAQLFVNDICEGASIIITPRHTTSGNTHALGAVVTLTDMDGVEQRRTIRSGAGYLSADPASVHFGLGAAAVDSVTIDWPDNTTTTLNGLSAGNHIVVNR